MFSFFLVFCFLLYKYFLTLHISRVMFVKYYVVYYSYYKRTILVFKQKLKLNCDVSNVYIIFDLRILLTAAETSLNLICTIFSFFRYNLLKKLMCSRCVVPFSIFYDVLFIFFFENRAFRYEIQKKQLIYF